MPEFLRSLSEPATLPLAEVLLRLVAALCLGAVVAQIYRRARSEPASSFTTTLVLMTVLIAMVTQIIGNNVALAFSLVGALSIVRFRTVVRDTQDTAYVIFAVTVGMAVGATTPWVAVIGVGVVALAAFLLRQSAAIEALPFRLEVRVGLGQDAGTLLGPAFGTYVAAQRLVEVATARQGAATEIAYRISLRSTDESAHALVKALNRLEGVQSVTLERVEAQGREP
jgi:hypothetical protein